MEEEVDSRSAAGRVLAAQNCTDRSTLHSGRHQRVEEGRGGASRAVGGTPEC
ncbi:unnamed protein product, partial [Pleuronectes platessa]